jgi:hypothetical protein
MGGEAHLPEKPGEDFVSEAEKPDSSPSSEAVSARAVYDDIVLRIKNFQAALDPDEKMVLSVRGVTTDAVGVRGATIWFQGRNNQGCAVVIAQHYTQVTVVMTAERLYRGEAPTESKVHLGTRACEVVHTTDLSVISNLPGGGGGGFGVAVG